MTIRLLCEYGRYPANAIVTLDAGTEAGLIAAKMALSNTAGGDAFAPAAGAIQTRSAPFTVSTARAVKLSLAEGQVLNVSGAAGTTGSVTRQDASGATVETWAVGVGALLPIGTFTGAQTLTISCIAGSIDCALGAPQIVMSSSASNNSDGRITGTLYVQAP